MGGIIQSKFSKRKNSDGKKILYKNGYQLTERCYKSIFLNYLEKIFLTLGLWKTM